MITVCTQEVNRGLEIGGCMMFTMQEEIATSRYGASLEVLPVLSNGYSLAGY